MKRQTDRIVTEFFQKLLELEDPWQVVAVELRDEDRGVEIEVEWPASYKASCTRVRVGLRSLRPRRDALVAASGHDESHDPAWLPSAPQ